MVQNYVKLETSLKSAISSLRFSQCEKIKLSKKLILQTLNCLNREKYVQAKIKALRIVKNEASIYAMELLERYCEQILERYELFKQMRKPETNLNIPVASLIWAVPYFQASIEGLKLILKPLAAKFGTNFCRLALRNKTGSVDPDLIEKVRFFVSWDEVRDCLQNICSQNGIVYREKQEQSPRKVLDESAKKYKEKSKKYVNQFMDEISDSKNMEFHAKGINKIDKTISSKKAFKEIMSKLDVHKLAQQNKCRINNICNDTTLTKNSVLK